MSQNTEEQETIEVAFRTPGFGWKRRTFTSARSFTRWADQLDEDIEVRVRS